MTGRLLVATPALTDPNFHRTVVLVCAHSVEGSFGLVLNRPIDGVRVEDVLPDWAALAVPPVALFRGGPVEPSRALALARLAAGRTVASWTPVYGDIGMVGLGEEVPAPSALVALRLFSGYSGWSSGQLEAEIEQEAWFVVPAAPADAFDPGPATLWRAVLRRQSGRLALFSFFPDDPRAN